MNEYERLTPAELDWIEGRARAMANCDPYWTQRLIADVRNSVIESRRMKPFEIGQKVRFRGERKTYKVEGILFTGATMVVIRTGRRKIDTQNVFPSDIEVAE